MRRESCQAGLTRDLWFEANNKGGAVAPPLSSEQPLLKDREPHFRTRLPGTNEHGLRYTGRIEVSQCQVGAVGGSADGPAVAGNRISPHCSLGRPAGTFIHAGNGQERGVP